MIFRRRRRALPPSCLLRMVYDEGEAAAAGPPAVSSAEEPAAARYVFRRKGEAWQVRFAGGPPFILLPGRGAAYLHLLL